MKEWQFNVLFFVGVGGALFLLLAPAIGLEDIPKNPGAITGIGTILAYVLTQRNNITKKTEDPKNKDGEKNDADTK
jgi:hypothetical protein